MLRDPHSIESLWSFPSDRGARWWHHGVLAHFPLADCRRMALSMASCRITPNLHAVRIVRDRDHAVVLTLPCTDEPLHIAYDLAFNDPPESCIRCGATLPSSARFDGAVKTPSRIVCEECWGDPAPEPERCHNCGRADVRAHRYGMALCHVCIKIPSDALYEISPFNNPRSISPENEPFGGE